MSWFWSPSPTALQRLAETELNDRLTNKTLLVVGGTAGIGKALAVACLKRGAHVTIVGRRQPEPGSPLDTAKCTFVQMDLSRMQTARTLADRVDFTQLDGVVFTNGIMSTKERQVNPEGVELDLAVSFLSRLAILRTVLERQQLKPTCRLFIMGFPGYANQYPVGDLNSEKSYALWAAHMNTVVANEALVKYLADYKQGASTATQPIHAFGLNPGLIKTDIRASILGKGWLSYFVEGTRCGDGGG